jgi:hypothetical protein
MKLSKLGKIFIAFVSICIIFGVSFYFANNKITEKMVNIDKHIDVMYYINLDHRDDRNRGFLEEIGDMDIYFNRVIRVPGIYKKGQGSLGCSMSHIKALEAFVASDYNTCIIFEDDFGFCQPLEVVSDLLGKLFDNNVDFDVCMLAGWDQEVEDVAEYPFLKKVIRGLTTSGYIVTKKFAPTLLENFKEGCKILEQKFIDGGGTYVTEYKYEIDEYWVQLQPKNNWYIFNPKLGKQRDTYSDVREREKIKEYDF